MEEDVERLQAEPPTQTKRLLQFPGCCMKALTHTHTHTLGHTPTHMETRERKKDSRDIHCWRWLCCNR